MEVDGSLESMLHGMEERLARRLGETRAALTDALVSGGSSARSANIVFLPDDGDSTCNCCGREFEPFRLAIHSRSCGRSKSQPPGKALSAQRQADALRRKAWEVLQEVQAAPPRAARASSNRPSAASRSPGPQERRPSQSMRPSTVQASVAPPPVAIPGDASTRRSTSQEAWYQEELALLASEEAEEPPQTLVTGGRNWQQTAQCESIDPEGDVDEPEEEPPRRAAPAARVPQGQGNSAVPQQARTPVQRQLFDRKSAGKAARASPPPPEPVEEPPPPEAEPPPSDYPTGALEDDAPDNIPKVCRAELDLIWPDLT